MKLPYAFCTLAIFAMGFSACNQPPSTTAETPVVETPENAEPAVVIHSMPAALHHADYLMISEAEYDKKLVVPQDQFLKLQEQHEKALLFGMMQADLGYAIAHDHKEESLRLFEDVKELGDQLKLFSTMEDDLIVEAEKHVNDKDKLKELVGVALEEAEYYLHEHEGQSLADLMAAGIWLENAWLSTQVIQKEHDQELMDRIGEDKLILPRIIEDLKKHEKNPWIAKLIQRLEKAEKVYAKIEIEHEDGMVSHDTVNAKTQIGTTHEVGFSMDRLAVITKIIGAIRNGYLTPQTI